jgi:hypothetical protein
MLAFNALQGHFVTSFAWLFGISYNFGFNKAFKTQFGDHGAGAEVGLQWALVIVMSLVSVGLLTLKQHTLQILGKVGLQAQVTQDAIRDTIANTHAQYIKEHQDRAIELHKQHMQYHTENVQQLAKFHDENTKAVSLAMNRVSNQKHVKKVVGWIGNTQPAKQIKKSSAELMAKYTAQQEATGEKMTAFQKRVALVCLWIKDLWMKEDEGLKF